MKPSKPIPILKSEAKRIAKERGIALTNALDQIAQREGFQSWSLLSKRQHDLEEAAKRREFPEKITALPLTGLLRRQAISVAKKSFSRALGRMESRNPRKARGSWNAEEYVDRILTPDMLPIETDYALHLIEVFIVMTAVESAVNADEDAP